MKKKTRAEPKQSYYNGKVAKKEICNLRHMFNKSCRGCVYNEECKENKKYENYNVEPCRN